MRAFLKRLLNDEDGQSTTEYILMLAIVVMIIVKLKKQLGDQIQQVMGTVGNSMEEAVK